MKPPNNLGRKYVTWKKSNFETKASAELMESKLVTTITDLTLQEKLDEKRVTVISVTDGIKQQRNDKSQSQ